MVHFDVPVTELAVSAREVEVAHLAAERQASTPRLLDLESAQLRVTLPSQGPPDEETPFDGCGARLIDFLRLGRDAIQLTRANALLDGLRSLEHLSFTADERFDHQQRWLAAPRSRSAVQRVICCKIGGLAADAVRRPEAGQREGVGAVNRK
ncbi:hypothetical protein [Streptomyces sp. MMG1121]|uniref:hypothetical protein n=1 Tax=Streptomyces sp. MMG1121 TaxID=1415544 RepID=UPI001F30EF59|nr:hypothetical protein [Streptomyces sp. MMG1121]